MKLNTIFISIRFVFTSILFLFHTSLLAQDTLLVEFNKTTQGCPIQGPMMIDQYSRWGTTYPKKIYNCGAIPELIIDSLPQFHGDYSGVILGKWYWISDNSDSLYREEIIDVLQGKIKTVKTKSYMYFWLNKEYFESDNLKKTTTYYTNGAVMMEAIWPNKGEETPYFIQNELRPKEEFHYNEQAELTAHVFYMDGIEFNDMFTHHGSIVIHLRMKGNDLVDVLNPDCLFLDRKGKLISKNKFFAQLKSGKIQSWRDEIFFDEYKMNCIDFVICDARFNFDNQRRFQRLKRKLNRMCENT